MAKSKDDDFAVLDLTSRTIHANPGYVVVRRGYGGPILALCPLFEEKVSDDQFTYAAKVQRALNHHDALVAALKALRSHVSFDARTDSQAKLDAMRAADAAIAKAEGR